MASPTDCVRRLAPEGRLPGCLHGGTLAPGLRTHALYARPPGRRLWWTGPSTPALVPASLVLSGSRGPHLRWTPPPPLPPALPFPSNARPAGVAESVVRAPGDELLLAPSPCAAADAVVAGVRPAKWDRCARVLRPAPQLRLARPRSAEALAPRERLETPLAALPEATPRARRGRLVGAGCMLTVAHRELALPRGRLGGAPTSPSRPMYALSP